MPERQCRLPADVRQQGRDRRGLRQGQARRQAAASRTTGCRRTRWSRASRSATTTRPTSTTRSIPASQNPHGVRMEMSHIFHVPENQIRVISPDVGGGFGLKGGRLSRRCAGAVGVAPLGRPVKWIATRVGEHADRPPRPRDGLLRRARARRERQDPRAARAGAVPASAPISSARRWRPARSRCASSRAPTTSRRMHIMSQGVFTNTSPIGPYRGAGRPEAAYFIERLIEQARARDRHGARRDPPPQPDPARASCPTRRRPSGSTTAASSSA